MRSVQSGRVSRHHNVAVYTILRSRDLCLSNSGLLHFLNKYLAGVANAILGVFHLHSSHPQAPITNYVAMQLVVFVLLVLVFVAVRSRLSVENPGNLQHVFESIDSMISQQGHRGHRPRLRTLHQLPHHAGNLHPDVQFDRADSGIRSADGGPVGAAGMRGGDLDLLPDARHPRERAGLHQALSGTGVVAGAADVRHRSGEPPGANSCRSPSVSLPTCLPATW